VLMGLCYILISAFSPAGAWFVRSQQPCDVFIVVQGLSSSALLGVAVEGFVCTHNFKCISNYLFGFLGKIKRYCSLSFFFCVYECITTTWNRVESCVRAWSCVWWSWPGGCLACMRVRDKVIMCVNIACCVVILYCLIELFRICHS